MKKILIVLLVSTLAFSSFAQSDSKATELLTYQVNKADVLLPFLLNLFLGFGIGSFVQGDVAGGFSILAFDAIGTSLIISGGVITLNKNNNNSNKTLGMSLALIGGATLFITRIVELVIPFTYASNYNAKLKNSLKIAFAEFEPSFNINANEATAIGFDLSFKKSY